jgi:hypothetical protein
MERETRLGIFVVIDASCFRHNSNVSRQRVAPGQIETRVRDRQDIRRQTARILQEIVAPSCRFFPWYSAC